MVNLELLDNLHCCPNGRPLFYGAFGDKDVSIHDAFLAIPKLDVIWFVVNCRAKGILPEYIEKLLPSDFKPTRKSPTIVFLNKNYNEFIKNVTENPESKALQALG